MKTKLRVAIIFGGQSAEHEVSVQSARNIYKALDSDKYEPVLAGIDQQGQWYICDQQQFLLLDRVDPLGQLKQGQLPAEIEKNFTPVATAGNNLFWSTIDVVFPIVHGTNGEDGTMQGMLKLLGVPFVGADVLGSAVGMDKDVSKRLLREAGIPIAKFRCLRLQDYKQVDFAELTAELGSVLFVKPANCGSSVGVNRVEDETGFWIAVEEAFRYDCKIIVEEAVPGREIECSVLGNEYPQASLPGEIVTNHQFYSYQAKYIDENGALLQIPAAISSEQQEEVRRLAVETYRVLCCEGMARVDFFLHRDGRILVNEINTLPGFTKISMYPKMWEASGLNYRQLIDRLLSLAIERHQRERSLKRTLQ